MKFIKLFFLFLTIESCTFNALTEENFIPKNYEDKILLISYLCPDLNNQQIYIGLTSKIGDSLKINKIPKSNIQVFIKEINSNDSFQVIRQISPSIYIFNQNEFKIESGKSYRISVKYQGKLTFGETNCPKTKTEFTEISTVINNIYINRIILNYTLKWKNTDVEEKYGYLISYTIPSKINYYIGNYSYEYT